MPATKRASSAYAAADAAAVKKLRVVLGGVAEAQLPRTTQELLSFELLHRSLGVPASQRHAYQQRVVGLVGGVIEGVEASLQTTVGEKDDMIKGAAREKSAQDDMKGEREASRQEGADEERKQQALLVASTKAFQAARTAVADAKTAQAVGDKESESVVQREHVLQATLVDIIRPLVSGAETGTDPSGTDVDTLIKILGGFGVNESMLTALPGALLKTPDARGPFDTIVINQLTDEIEKLLGALRAIIADAAPARAAREGVVTEKGAAFKAAKEHITAAAADYSKAKGVREAADDALQAASEASGTAACAATQATKALGKAKAVLERFQSGPLLAFTELRDATEHALDQQEETAEAEIVEKAAAAEAPELLAAAA